MKLIFTFFCGFILLSCQINKPAIATHSIFDKNKPFEVITAERGITGQSSAKDTNMCTGWNIPQNKIGGIIKDCELIDGHQWHYLFDNLPCIITGQIKQNEESYEYEINAGSWLYIYCKDTTLRLANYKYENDKYFLSYKNTR